VPLKYHEVIGCSGSRVAFSSNSVLLLFLILVLLDEIVFHGIDDRPCTSSLAECRLGRAAELNLELYLLLLLELHLLLVELVDCLREDLSVVVRRVECDRGVLFNPQVLRRFEVVAED
jgi:hypothetical protein